MKRKILTKVSVVFIVLGIIFAAIPTNWIDPKQIIAFGATLLGFILATISLIMPNHYSCTISKNDWSKTDDGDYAYNISETRHGIGENPNVIVYQKGDRGKYSVCGVNVNVDEKGNIKIESNLLIDCKVIIS